MTLTDTDKMPFGRFKGEDMANVPDDYLKWFWEQNEAKYKANKLTGSFREVMEYIEDFGPENL